MEPTVSLTDTGKKLNFFDNLEARLPFHFETWTWFILQLRD